MYLIGMGMEESCEKIINLLWLSLKVKQIYALIISSRNDNNVSRAPN